MGTQCVFLISWCRIHVVKDFQDRYIGAESIPLIEEAIRWSVLKCEVDITIIPFGLKNTPPTVVEAINMAVSKKMVCLAATGDSGANEKATFPARQQGVLPMYATDGFGNPAANSHHHRQTAKTSVH